ncbi:MAG TPA: adaptor protein MecA [Lachnospiraceae bacterium]|nr:adaptor protein MecA [Lachnospiraceae bacterium]
MKIEKISDKQIRCTLTSEDLASRQLKISELAYGTDKAKELFRDMMLRARKEFGFNAENIPLMIEAVPASADSIVLIITKVDDPEELDTRFSKFTSSKPSSSEDIQIAGADEVIDMLHKIYESKAKASRTNKPSEDGSVSKEEKTPEGQVPEVKNVPKKKEQKITSVDLVRLFQFSSIDNVINASRALGTFYNGSNSLFRLKKNGIYQLVIHQGVLSAVAFNKVCNVLSEYSKSQTYTPAAEAHLAEHEVVVLPNRALQKLRELG